MVRRHGLAIDNLVGARVVTADGRLVTASAEEHADLFWALRGGGGNFGVVVDFDFVAQPVSTVHYGTITYQVDDPADLLRRWRDAMRLAPEELSSTLALLPQMPGAPRMANVLLCFAGAPGTAVTDADAAIEPMLELGTVTQASITEQQVRRDPGGRAASPGRPAGRTQHPGADPRGRCDRGDRGPVRRRRVRGVIAVRSLGGAFARVPSDATAFAHRDAEAMVVGMVILPETATDADVERALEPWRTVAAYGTGTYINFQGSATDADVAAAYPPATYARLAAVKSAYDPGNLFALNHNIEPAPAQVAEGPAA